jgi:uncharacterized membrane protein
MDTTPQAVSPHQLARLRDELPRWQAQGLVTGEHAAAILGQYRAVKRAGLARLMLYLGAAFVGVGLIWLVAANLDQLPPFLRFVVVTALWLGITAVAEVLGSRADHGTRSPVVGAARGLSALAFGAVVFQAAQSLQVPAYEPALVGFWGLEPLVAIAVAVVSGLLVLWDPGTDPDSVGLEGWAHAGVSIAAYVATATWIAVLGIRRSSDWLTYLALAALVVFTTFQSFAVFAQIIQGAWLFVVLGLVFLGSGYLFDRARRELAEAVAA